VVATVFCVVLGSLLCILYDLCNCLHCCMNDILSILLYDCVKCPCLMKKVTFSSNKGGRCQVQAHKLARFWATYVIAFLRH